MRVRDARAVARRWVGEAFAADSNVRGAFFHGSTNWLADDAVLPPVSDLDVMLVVTEPPISVKLGKIVVRDVLLDVSFVAGEQVRTPEDVLGNLWLADSFREPGIIFDRGGQLAGLQTAVAREYAKRRWVERRCDHAEATVRRHLRSAGEADPFHDRVTAWLFAAGVTAYLPLVAGLVNPTVRRRYVAARDVLAAYGRSAFYPEVLALLGSDAMSRSRVDRHLAALTDAFDAAKQVVATPLFFATDISDAARPIAIDGSRELIERGDHREAVFWIVATYARCLKILHHDAPPGTRERFDAGFRRLLGELGIASAVDLRRRGEEVEAFLPRVRAVADAIMTANTSIEE